MLRALLLLFPVASLDMGSLPATAGDGGRSLGWSAAAEVDAWLSAILGAGAVTVLRALSPAAAPLLLGWDIGLPSAMGPDTILGGGDCGDPVAKRAYNGVGPDTL